MTALQVASRFTEAEPEPFSVATDTAAVTVLARTVTGRAFGNDRFDIGLVGGAKMNDGFCSCSDSLGPP